MKNLLYGALSVLCWISLSASAATITFVDENGTPLAGADVLIGKGQNDPFPGNSVKADATGKINTPAGFSSAQPLTVTHPGHVTTTYQNVLPQNQTLRIATEDGQSTFDVQGLTSGFGNLKEDGKIDFGLVFPAFPVNNLVRFDMSSVVSPIQDKITVMGRDVSFPSNITLPPQDESYIFSIHFEKPNYLMPLRQAGNYTMTALHGQFPLQKVVGEVRGGKSLIETLNNFTFLETGLKVVPVTKSVNTENLDVNQFQFKDQGTLTAPSFGSNQFMLAVALAEDGGVWKPTDIKRFSSGETRKLVTNTSLGTTKFLSVLTSQAGPSSLDILTQALMNLVGEESVFTQPMTTAGSMNYQQFSVAVANQPSFLGLVPAPVIQAGSVQVTQPTLPAGLTDAGCMLIYSEIERPVAGSNFEKRTRLWEHISTSWTSSFTLTSVGMPSTPGKEYRWEVLFMAKDSSGKITHVTRNVLGI